MKILFLTFYYPPDLCACSFRAEPIVQGLLAHGKRDITVDVVTTMPNRYKTHRETAAAEETADRVTIHRAPMPDHKSGMIDQSRAFASYARFVKKFAKGKQWDLVLATSSRLMTASLGASIARKLKLPLYLDIRDLFADTIKDVLGAYTTMAILPVLKIIEKRAFTTAKRINVVSDGFLPYVSKIATKVPISCFTHGIDNEFLEYDFSDPNRDPAGPFRIVYAGNLGEGQGFHKIIPPVAKQLQGKAVFRLIGDGGLRGKLEEAIRENQLTNVELLSALPRAKILEHYRHSDILLCHLNDLPAFHKVLPSKLFEQAATGKRMLAGVAGNALSFIDKNIPGCEVFPPCDAQACLEKIDLLRQMPESIDRTKFKQTFSRQNVIKQLVNDIVATVQ